MNANKSKSIGVLYTVGVQIKHLRSFADSSFCFYHQINP